MSEQLEIPSQTYRVPRRGLGMDAGTRRLAIIAGGLGGALVVLVGAWSMIGRHHAGVPVIEADSSPLRVKPDNPGGMNIAGQNDEILSGDADGSVGKLAPPSETPAPQNIKPPTVLAKLVPPAPVTAAPMPTMAPAGAVAKAPAAAPPHVAAVIDHPEHAAGGKGTLVQLAAVASEDAAKTEWDKLAKRMPDLFGHRQPAVTKVEHDGKTLYRLRTGGFADIAQATAFCEQVRAKGNGCSIAAF